MCVHLGIHLAETGSTNTENAETTQHRSGAWARDLARTWRVDTKESREGIWPAKATRGEWQGFQGSPSRIMVPRSFNTLIFSACNEPVWKIFVIQNSSLGTRQLPVSNYNFLCHMVRDLSRSSPRTRPWCFGAAKMSLPIHHLRQLSKTILIKCGELVGTLNLFKHCLAIAMQLQSFTQSQHSLPHSLSSLLL